VSYATDAEFLLRVSAVSVVSAPRRALALEDAAAMIDDAQWGLRTARAQCFLAAHYLQLDPSSGLSGGEGGIVSSRSAGEIAVSYAVPPVPAGWDPSLVTTSYGRQFLSILDTIMSYPEAV